MTKATKGIKIQHPYIDSNINEVLIRKEFRKNAPCICSKDGIIFRFDGNEWLSNDKFESVYPELHIRKNNWRNYDRTKNYLHGEQSY
jgi:hypothetical protein